MAVSVDNVLKEIGGYSRYQILILQLVGFIEFATSSFHVMIITFIAGEPTWECVANSTVCNITGVVGTASDHYTARCDMPRSAWKFSDTFTSTVTEFELVCQKSFLQNVSSSLFWLGWLLETLIFGIISDKIGRRKTILFAALTVATSSWLIVWLKYLSVYILCRILTGIGCAGTTTCGFILLVEYSGVKHRSWAGTNVWHYSALCILFMSLLAYLIREWRYLMLYGAAMSLPAIVASWFVPESCRFLLVNKRHDDALKQLKTVARINRKPMPSVELEVPQEIAEEKSDVRDLFYNKNVAKITTASWLTWFCCALVTYSVNYGSIYLGGNMYLNFFLIRISTLPATLTSIFCMQKLGRRKAIVGGLIVATVASIISVSIPSDQSDKGYSAGRVIMAIVCLYSIVVAFNTVYVYSTEIFPTSVRTIGMGTSSACGRVGSFLALYNVWLIRIHPLLPYSVVAALCIITGLVCFTCLPETTDKPTPESMASVVEIKRIQTYSQEIKDNDGEQEGKKKDTKNDKNMST